MQCWNNKCVTGQYIKKKSYFWNYVLSVVLIFHTGCFGCFLWYYFIQRGNGQCFGMDSCLWVCLNAFVCKIYIWETWWWEQMRPCRWSGGLEGLTCLPWCVYLTVISQESCTCYLDGSYVDRWKTLSPQSNIQLLIQAAILDWKKFGITKQRHL